MPSTMSPALIALMRDNWEDYRERMADPRANRFSPQRQAIMNSLESHLAVRPVLRSGQQVFSDPRVLQSQLIAKHKADKDRNTKIATAALSSYLTKKHMPENRVLAFSALRLTPRKVTADELKAELDCLGAYILSKSPADARWIPGPLKKVEKAMSKTEMDYDFGWAENKDLVRGTFACQSNDSLKVVTDLLRAVAVAKFGIGLIKMDKQSSIRDGGKMVTGYSGWNFALQFRDHPAFPAEIQANVYGVIYGKSSKKDMMDACRLSEDDYAGYQKQFGFAGSLGHALYDISDKERNRTHDAEAAWALELARDYYDACRGVYRSGMSLHKLNDHINKTASMLTSPKARELWKHAVAESKWAVPIPA